MIFEKIKTIPTSEELLDKSFRRATRAMAGKEITGPVSRREANESMLLTAANILTDNLTNITKMFPSIDSLPPFYYDLAEILVGTEKLKASLSRVDWAARKIHDLARDHVGKMREGKQLPEQIRKEAFGRISSIIYGLDKDLLVLNEARNVLRKLPDVRDEPTVIVAGYPNVGKSSFVARVTTAAPEIAPYPFTTKGLTIGHLERNGVRYQIMDTPGLLDRPMSDRNDIELHAITALKRLDAIVLILIDPSESCGYALEAQRHLAEEIKTEFGLPVVIAENKADRDEFMKQDDIGFTISTLTGEGVDALTDHLISLFPERKPDYVQPPLRDGF
ncbi:MAG: NOG1 family protein [Methanosarcinaceae archaeon]|nr:NOG1 family protein [Methanosarcinaceae archaeon]